MKRHWNWWSESEQSEANKVAKDVATDKANSGVEDEDDSWGDWTSKGRAIPTAPPTKANAMPTAEAASNAIPKAMPQVQTVDIPMAMCKSAAVVASIPKASSKACPRMRGTVATGIVMRPGTTVCGLRPLLPSGNGQCVYIWPTGIMNLHSVNKDFQVRERTGGHFDPNVDDMMMDFKAILPSDQREIVSRSFIVIVDARGPPAQAHAVDPMLQDHIGTHPDIMGAILDDDELTIEIARQLMDQWPDLPLHEFDAITVIVYSDLGRHRSVAWSYLIQALLLSDGVWPRRP